MQLTVNWTLHDFYYNNEEYNEVRNNSSLKEQYKIAKECIEMEETDSWGINYIKGVIKEINNIKNGTTQQEELSLEAIAMSSQLK